MQKCDIHYGRSNNRVFKLDRSGRERCKDTILVLDHHADISWVNHAFADLVYAQTLKEEYGQRPSFKGS